MLFGISFRNFDLFQNLPRTFGYIHTIFIASIHREFKQSFNIVGFGNFKHSSIIILKILEVYYWPLVISNILETIANFLNFDDFLFVKNL